MNWMHSVGWLSRISGASRLKFRCIRNYYGIAALFSRLVDAELRAVDQVRDDVFAFEFLPRRSFHDPCAQRDLRRIPRRANSRRRAAQLFDQVVRSRGGGIRQNEG